MTFSNVAFVNCSFDDTVSDNSNYKNTYFIGCHYHDLIAEGENDTDTMHEFPFCDIQPSPCEDGTVHHSSNVDERRYRKTSTSIRRMKDFLKTSYRMLTRCLKTVMMGKSKCHRIPSAVN